MDMPIWIWFVFIGIIVSAIMSIWTARQERLIDDAWIEKEGQKYIERMEEERERRKKDINQGA
ncbi:sporulation YhaL family protein [Peribacillus frigoritolerans]|uniref:Sporulation YhaL family protein n=2 Tax=Bacillaceae TaxID=186817 RepID=A0AAW9N7C2_9BACI|nr:sporulation YhaL family protein [Peribacillus frigoritolerans]MEC0273736.1 sporulation YhaL family protein [Peribacillus castrilensis]MCU6603080.1 sporulation YhaL family protein [Peribacillus frigoritolerans]MDM5305114.1 sporulation YhaL family protein [Peribacillus frigoritolerans]MEC0297923.1 sporulation YhaL family protein [Peribacillus castrilensis]MEC0343348.1 sporulation YhaL family protein [Peribacillus castrilensis]